MMYLFDISSYVMRRTKQVEFASKQATHEKNKTLQRMCFPKSLGMKQRLEANRNMQYLHLDIHFPCIAFCNVFHVAHMSAYEKHSRVRL